MVWHKAVKSRLQDRNSPVQDPSGFAVRRKINFDSQCNQTVRRWSILISSSFFKTGTE